ncbi:Uncharacterised protein [Streptococcus dysgalactiae]|nr:Uncharacterised protein [Streptococcus dysgalactiae]
MEQKYQLILEIRILNSIINETIDTLVYFPYTESEIKEVVKNIVEFNKINDSNVSELLYIGMKDSMGVESYGYVPFNIIEELWKEKERN